MGPGSGIKARWACLYIRICPAKNTDDDLARDALEAALCGRSQFAAKPARDFAGLHGVVPFGGDLVDAAAQLALEGADVKAQVAGRDPRQHSYAFADWT